MKKILLAILAGCMSFFMSAQGFFAEVNLGFPTGDMSEELGFEYNFKSGYLFEVTSDLSVGPIFGLSLVTLKDEYSGDGDGFRTGFFKITIGGAARYNISEKVLVGIDLEHGGARVNVLSDQLDVGGFTARPLIGYRIGQKVTINASYESIPVNEDGLNSLNSFLLGISFIR